MNLTIAEEYLRTKHNLPEGFSFYSWECLPHDGNPFYVQFKGCVPAGVYKSGPRKGSHRYKEGTDKRVLNLPCAEYDQEEIAWTQRTGKCPKCLGEGKRVASSSVKDGTTYRPCRDCTGTGKALTP